MDPKALYWTWAFANMAGVVGCGWVAVRHAKRRAIRAHRRMMLFAVAGVFLFLGSYPVKLVYLGRENLEVWSAFHVWALRFHETCIAVMVLAGGTALFLAVRHRFLAAPPAGGRARLHRRAGRTAAAAGALAFLSAGLVLSGMYARM